MEEIDCRSERIPAVGFEGRVSHGRACPGRAGELDTLLCQRFAIPQMAAKCGNLPVFRQIYDELSGQEPDGLMDAEQFRGAL